MSQLSVLLSKPLSSLSAINPIERRQSAPVGRPGAACVAGGAVNGVTRKLDLSLGSGFLHRRGFLCPHDGFRGNCKKHDMPRGRTVACTASAPLFHPQTLHWVSAVASVILMFSRATPIQKSLLAPLFALQAPTNVISWIKGEYGNWTALLALLVRLFYHVPGEVELPLIAMLLAIVAPTQTMNLRGTPAAAIISLVIAGYLAYQHFTKHGTLENAFDSTSIVPSLALICALAAPCLLLFMY